MRARDYDLLIHLTEHPRGATLAAMAYKYTVGQPFIYPKNELDYATNFLRMCFAVPTEDYKANPVLARAMVRTLDVSA